MPFYQRSEFLITLAYLVLMIGIGLRFAKRNRGGADYFTGGRTIPWWVSGISLYMGNFSAWLFTGGAGLIYRTTGYGLLYFLLTGSVAYYVGSQLTAVPWRRSRLISPIEFTRVRFGLGTQQVLSVITSIVFLAAAGNQLRAIASIVESVLGVPIRAAAIAIGVIVILYTLIGGLWAVMVTDVVQFLLLAAMTLLLALLCLHQIEGGLATVWSEVDWSLPPPMGEPHHDLHFLVAGWISFTLGVASGAGPRFYSVPDERSARKVGALAAALFLMTPFVFAIPALVARVLWPDAASLAERIPLANPHEQVFVTMATEVLPPGLLGLFLAAMFAATMSALDSVCNQVASVLSRDVYAQFRPNLDDRQLLRIGRAMTLLFGLVTIALGLLYIEGGSDLFTVMTDIFYTAAPITAIPLLMGLLFRQAPRATGMACIFVGVCIGLTTKFVLAWTYGPQIYLTQLICLSVFLLAPWLGRLWREDGGRLRVALLLSVLSAFLFGLLELGTRPEALPAWVVGQADPITRVRLIAAACALVIGAGLGAFAHRFARSEALTEVSAFYADLDRPVATKEVPTAAATETQLLIFVARVGYALALVALLWMAFEQVLMQPDEPRLIPYLGLAAMWIGVGAWFHRIAARRLDLSAQQSEAS